RAGGAHRVDVEAGLVADAAGARTAVAEQDGRRAVGVARRDPNRRADLHAGIGQFRDIDDYAAALAAGRADVRREAQALGRFWADKYGVIPRELRQRFRQFLQPAVVSETAVENRRIGTENNFQDVFVFRLGIFRCAAGQL